MSNSSANSDLSLLDVLSNGLIGVFILLLILSIRMGSSQGITDTGRSEELGLEFNRSNALDTIRRKPKDNPPIISIFLTIWGKAEDLTFEKKVPDKILDAAVLVTRGAFDGTKNEWLIIRNRPDSTVIESELEWFLKAKFKTPPDSITVHIFRGVQFYSSIKFLAEDLKNDTYLLKCTEGVSFDCQAIKN